MALSHKETLKLVITREDTGEMYSMAIKDYSVTRTPGSANQTSIPYSQDGVKKTENHITSRETGSVSFQALETDDPTTLSHLEWDQILESNTVRFTAQVTENVSAKVKSYDVTNATMEIGANEAGSFQVTLKGNITNIVK
jgi:hypothetical protein